MKRVIWKAALSSVYLSSAPSTASAFRGAAACSSSRWFSNRGRNSEDSNMNMAKLESPSAERNKHPIWQVVRDEVLPDLEGDELEVLEIASGAGIHAHYLTSQFLLQGGRSWRWQPADTDARYMSSVQAYIDEDPTLNKVILPPVRLTLDETGIIENETKAMFRNKTFDLIINVNMIHISPWSATQGLMKLAGEKLRSGGVLFLYGPYRVDGKCVESNEKFDASLKQRDPRWGLRELEAVVREAERNGIQFIKTIEMPANNLVVLLRKKK